MGLVSVWTASEKRSASSERGVTSGSSGEVVPRGLGGDVEAVGKSSQEGRAQDVVVVDGPGVGDEVDHGGLADGVAIAVELAAARLDGWLTNGLGVHVGVRSKWGSAGAAEVTRPMATRNGGRGVGGGLG